MAQNSRSLHEIDHVVGPYGDLYVYLIKGLVKDKNETDLGAKEVTAVDLNPLCVKTAQKNVALNQLKERISVFEGEAEDFVDVAADLVISNIYYEAIATLLGTEGFRRKGWLIISGLMRSQVRDVRVKLEKFALKIIHEWDLEMTWYTLLVQNEKGHLE